MKRILLALILLAAWAGGAWAQSPDCIMFFHFTALNQTSPTSPNNGFDNRTGGCTTWSLSVAVSGFSSASVTLQSAPNSAGTPGTYVTFAGGTVISASPHNVNPVVTSTQDFVWITGYNPWVRVKLTALGSGSGIVDGAAYGWRDPSSSANGTGGGGSIAANVTIVGPLGQAAMAASIPVVIASDQSSVGVNVASVGGTATVSGGLAGTLGVGGGAATGATPTTNPVPVGKIDTAGHIITPQNCNSSAAISWSSASGNVLLVAASGSTKVYVCHVLLQSDTVQNVKLVYGTGATCGSGTANLTGPLTSTVGIAYDGEDGGLSTPASQALCVNLSASSSGGGVVVYGQH